MKKVILVPSEVTQLVKPVDKTLGNLDHEMSRILESSEIPFDVKLLQYNQILQQYKNLQTERNKPYSLEIHEESAPAMDFETILKGIPEKKLPQAKLLTDFILKQGSIQLESNGEITVNGNRIHSSNIIDLVHDLIRDRKTNLSPVGLTPLVKALKQANIPFEYIGNKKRIDLFHQTPPAERSRQWIE